VCVSVRVRNNFEISKDERDGATVCGRGSPPSCVCVCYGTRGRDAGNDEGGGRLWKTGQSNGKALARALAGMTMLYSYTDTHHPPNSKDPNGLFNFKGSLRILCTKRHEWQDCSEHQLLDVTYTYTSRVQTPNCACWIV
jgi:hypothetical protein